MLAYHSVEHMGLIAFGLGMGPVGAAGAVMHMIGHTLAKSALFFTAGEILLRTAHDEDRQHHGAVANARRARRWRSCWASSA